MMEDSLNWQLSNNPDLEKLKNLLLQSYYALPHRLKLCFLYCAAFPEDCLIWRPRLRRLWIAEGFLEEIQGLTPEDVADTYITELVRRGLLQRVAIGPSGMPNTCKMHDILRELAISISTVENYFNVCTDQEGVNHSTAPMLSFQANIPQSEPSLFADLSKVRSCFMFISRQAHLSADITLKFSRVLDLEELALFRFPDQIFSCYNLRYLNMAKTNVREVPNCIGKLVQLLTLDLSNTHIQVLPHGITKLQNLRHLFVYRDDIDDGINFTSVYGVQVTANICRLKSLHALTCVEANGELVRKLWNLTNLRRLHLCKVTEEVEEDICLATEKMKYLSHLFVLAADENRVLRLEALSSKASQLRSLGLSGKIENVPSWFPSLQNLEKLTLHWTRFEDDFLPYIEALPNLDTLFLTNAYVGEQLCFGAGLQKLRILRIWNCPQLKLVIINEGMMSGIQTLYVGHCSKLTMVNGIEYLKSLQRCLYTSVTHELISHFVRNLSWLKLLEI